MKIEIVLTQTQLLTKFNSEKLIFNTAVKNNQIFSNVKPLYLRMKATQHNIEICEQKNADSLNDEMANFDRRKEYIKWTEEMFF